MSTYSHTFLTIFWWNLICNELTETWNNFWRNLCMINVKCEQVFSFTRTYFRCCRLVSVVFSDFIVTVFYLYGNAIPFSNFNSLASVTWMRAYVWCEWFCILISLIGSICISSYKLCTLRFQKTIIEFSVVAKPKNDRTHSQAHTYTRIYRKQERQFNIALANDMEKKLSQKRKFTIEFSVGCPEFRILV